jgi:hypothetical protein
MKMSLNVTFHNSPYPLYDHDDELPLFQYHLLNLEAYLDATIEFDFGSGKKMYLEMYLFSVWYCEVIRSILDAKHSAQSSFENRKSINFYEQGVDFYFYYNFEGDIMHIEVKQGIDDCSVTFHEFSASITKNEYVFEWEKILKEFNKLFKKFLNITVEPLPC